MVSGAHAAELIGALRRAPFARHQLQDLSERCTV
jgi:hypothetical protein